jgi:hypothetical protein
VRLWLAFVFEGGVSTLAVATQLRRRRSEVPLKKAGE